MLLKFATRSNPKSQDNYLTGILRSHIKSQYLAGNDSNKISFYVSIVDILYFPQIYLWWCYLARFNMYSVALSVDVTSLQKSLLSFLINILFKLSKLYLSKRMKKLRGGQDKVW